MCFLDQILTQIGDFNSLIYVYLMVDFGAEFTKVAIRTAIGFVAMGFVGFFVKLVFIPINNIIVGSV